MKVSLIISTYNRPDALRLCLLSAFAQSRVPDEIIVGDDGSRDDTRKLIEEMRKDCPTKLIHVWQEDNGFRLAMMRNKSVAASTGEYIIEVDGDVILHCDYVKDHLHFAERGYYLKGGRTNLGKRLTEKLCEKGELVPIHWWTRGIESKPENSIHLPGVAEYLALRYRRKREGALGCNMSFFRDDYMKLNGYDEFYEGWGGEDGDFGRRLQMSGLTKKHLKFAGIVYHLWHEDKYMQNKQLNFDHSIRPDIKVRCDNGIDKYLTDSTEK